MSKRGVALVAGRVRGKSSGKAVAKPLLGGAAIACLVLGCGFVVYDNIIAASVYPTLGSAGYDEPVVAHPRLASRSVAEMIGEAFAALPVQKSKVAKTAPIPPISPTMFNERFAAAEPQSVASNAASAAPPPEAPKLAEAAKPAAGPKLADAKRVETPKLAEAAKSKSAPQQVALNVPPPSRSGMSVRAMAERAKEAVMSITGGDRKSMVDKLWGKPASRGTMLAYASADASVTGAIPHEQSPAMGGSPPYDRDTAVYDITAHMVYLPDGTKLEAHSGLGSNLDDPRSARIRMRGVTPPHIYELKPREALFHGVPALRLTPIGGEDTIYGRDGLLAHTFMLGPNGDSNGCVSFRDYNAFLDAYRNKGIRKLAVVARID